MTVADLTQAIDLQWFESVYEAVQMSGDAVGTNRIRELINQYRTSFGKIHVAFCGLFSAGKSSLLNTICVSTGLATGAVPTTAEVAKVQLPGSNGLVVLLDTPGVDSTDDTHRQATEEAMYLADVIALVMDYQHVEAEDNLQLARSFSEQGKRLILIVNQVDKHFDFELSFETYVARVERILDDEGIQYEALFYTSSKPSPYNQVAELSAWLEKLGYLNTGGQTDSYSKRLTEIVTDHVRTVFSPVRDHAQQILQQTYGSVPYSHEEATAWLESAQTEKDQLEQQVAQAVTDIATELEQYREEFIRLIELAQISPYETTERGRNYIESLRPEFKIGWFRSRQKTADEQTKRLQAFVDDVTARTEKFLSWPLQNRLRQFVQNSSFANQGWLEQIPELVYSLSSQEAVSIVKQGALVSSHYPYQYVLDVIASIKRTFITMLTIQLDEWFIVIRTAAREAQVSTISLQLSALVAKIESVSTWQTICQEEAQKIELLLTGSEVGMS